ncbi:CDP-diacylglycerol-inositol 3-phosphatidyltransferase [Borealophlyctis nickersoniae]|nr:CDP-diacylglycerol-inositol 3-phosphatidyltransferase [Borealophlyctis nickersoniae]
MPPKENVFLFIPNLIGYARVLLGIIALAVLPYNAWGAMGLYSVSSLLDALDGHAARYFRQTSRFGAVLDMVTDRSTTSCLLVYLCVQRPALTLVFQLLIALDLSSHYMHMYASLTTGNTSHKKLDEKSNWLLRQYYTNSNVLFLVCAGDQLCFIALYLMEQLAREGAAAAKVGAAGGPAGLGFATVLFWTTLPVCAFKQALNVVQLIGASKTLANVDLAARETEAKESAKAR